MARYKAMKPNPENSKEARARKDAKRKITIFRVASYIYLALLIAGVILTGTNGDDNHISGWGYVVMGIVSLLFVAFVIYAELKGWYKNYKYWEERRLLPPRCIDEEKLKEDLVEHRFAMILIGLIYLGVTVYMFVLGIRALYGIM